MVKPITAYFLVVVIYGAFLFFGPEGGLWIQAAGSIVAVTAGLTITELSLLGLFSVVILLSLVLPVSILVAIGVRAGVDLPLIRVLQDYEWSNVATPLITTVATYVIVCAYRSRSSKQA